MVDTQTKVDIERFGLVLWRLIHVEEISMCQFTLPESKFADQANFVVDNLFIYSFYFVLRGKVL